MHAMTTACFCNAGLMEFVYLKHMFSTEGVV